MSVILASLSALCYGAADFSGGYASRATKVHAVLFWSQLVGLAAAALASPLVGPNGPSLADLGWGAAAGLSGVLGLAALYHGLARTVVAVVSPAAAVVGAAVPLLFGVLSGERPGVAAWVGVVAAVPALLLLTTSRAQGTDRKAVRRAALIGVAAGGAFGAFFIMISRPAPAAGLWPLVAARVASLAALLGYASLGARPLRLERPGAAAALAAGALDMAANVLFVLAARAGLLSVATVVTSLYPAPTVLLARLFLGERLTAGRVAGMLLALAAVALMSAG